MNASRTTIMQANNLPQAEESRPGYRTKTVSMRLSPSEVAEIESAAQRSQKPLAEWLRETVLTAARERPYDPVELVLAEIWAVRHALLGLFHAGAQATVEGKPMLPESILKIRDKADREKLEQARRILADFRCSRAGEDGEVR